MSQTNLPQKKTTLPPTLWIRPGQVCWVGNYDIQKKEVTNYFAAFIQTSNHSLQNVRVKYLDNIDAPTEVAMKFILMRSDDNKINFNTMDNLINLPILNEAELVQCIKIRFQNNQIFSYVGQTLIIVNPFKDIFDLFSNEVIENFKHCARKRGFILKQEQSHIYAVAALTYNQLFEYYKSQAIVISGESGTGKTVNTKLCMKLIVQMSSQKQNANQYSHQLEQQIINCNPILEAFGNAKTIKNDNSSRFGKFVSIFIDMKLEKIMGARTQSYLLEKSRVISQSKEERNYHIFYSLMYSNDSELLQSLGLKEKNQKVNLTKFNYLNKSECYTVNSINDETLYFDVCQALSTLEIDTIDPKYIWQILAAILHLGNLEFDDKYADSNSDQPCQIIQSGNSTCENISTFLGVPLEKLKETLLKKVIRVGNKEPTTSSKQKIDVISHLHSLSKDLYDKLFYWLIKRMNDKLMQLSEKEIQQRTIQNEMKQIGLLDIFGFEVLQNNSFEQLCINYANEVLQQLYIEYTFKAEQIEFEEEGLQDELSQIPFSDNNEVINLLDKPPFGLFHQIDENCSLATAGDDGLYNKIKEQHKANQLLIVPTIKSDKFTIQHTPRQVQYSILGFRAKNKDEMNLQFIQLLSESKNPIVNDIYYAELQQLVQNQTSQKVFQAKDKFIGTKFRKQINQLMSELRQSDVHFIRCVKPNESKQPNQFNDDIMLNQLRYLGVLDTIKIRKEGFPVRKEYKDYFRKFGEIMDLNATFTELEKQKADFRKYVVNAELWKNSFQPKDNKKQVVFGKTKICFRSDAYDQLELIYQEKMKKKTEATIQIQRIARGYLSRKQTKVIRKKLLLINRWFKSRLVRMQFLKKKKAAERIKKFYKQVLFKKIRKMAMVIQLYMKRQLQLRNYQHSIKQIIITQRYIKKQVKVWKQKRYINFKRTIVLNSLSQAWYKITNRNATMIQKIIKGHLVRQVFHADKIKHIKIHMIRWHQNKAATKIQKVMRGILGRKYAKDKKSCILYIQRHYRIKWLCEFKQKLNNAAISLQKIYRLKSEKSKTQRSYFFNEDLALQNIQMSEQSAMVTSKMQLLDQSRKDCSLIQNLDSKEARINRDYLTPADKKISFFLFLLDYEILTDTSEIYDPLWNKQFSYLQKEMLQTSHDITHIQVGDTHSIASSTNGKIYGWGWNDLCQLGIDLHENYFCTKKPAPIPWIEEITRPKMFSVGSNHTFFLDVDNNLYVQGKNNQGQLGLGHNEIVQDPERLDLNIKADDRIKIIKSRYEQSVIVTEKGVVFIWPFQLQNNNWINEPFELAFPSSKVLISQVSCGLKFSIFLSNNGVLYSMGSNEQGELGLGDCVDRNIPCQIESLKNSAEKIQQVECGQKHTICKSGLNKIYTWGFGAKGQLGHENKQNEYYPRQMNLNANYSKQKIMQVQAGQKSSLVLFDNKKILWWGTNSRLKYQSSPAEVDFSQIHKTINNQDFYPVRIETTWSKSVSLTYIRMADTRTFDQGTQFKQKLINTLIQKWQESYLNTMDVPFFETISKNISNRHVLKHFSAYKRVGPKYPKQKAEKYYVVQNSSPSKKQDEFYEESTLGRVQNSSVMTSFSPSKPFKDVFQNFIENTTKKENKILKSQNQLEGGQDEFASPLSKLQGKEEENLLDTMKVSPNSLFEKYKNENKNQQKVSQFEINIHKVNSLGPNQNMLQKMKSLQSTKIQPPQFGIVKQVSSNLPPNRGSIDSESSQIISSRSKSKEKPKQNVKFSDNQYQKSSFSSNLRETSGLDQNEQKQFGLKYSLPTSEQSMLQSQTIQAQNQNGNSQESLAPQRDSSQNQNSRKENRASEKAYLKQNMSTIKELKFNNVTKDQVKYPFINDEKYENKVSENDEFINSLHQKLAGIKSRMQTLARIPKEEWTLDDHQFMSEVSNSKMIEFFKSIS
ncbi:hypothetical protein ABPG72_011752 [Tetrahymena utriculariae]